MFLVDSDVRLMPNAADDAGEWAFEHSPTERVLVRDVIDDINGVPRHRMLCLLVTCHGTDLDDSLLGHARELAESTLILLSASSRAQTADVEFFVAYEVSENEKGRAILQWLIVPDLPQPRTPAPHALNAEVWEAIHRAAADDQPLAQSVVLSMSWYRRALRETEVLFRFSNLWLSLETLTHPLADSFSIPPNKRGNLAGLRKFLVEQTGGNGTFKRANRARNDMFHGDHVLPAAIRATVEPMIGTLDDAVVSAWRRLLSISDEAVGPSVAVWPHPDRFIIRARLKPDEEGWSEARHPWFEQEDLNITGREPEAPGKIRYDVSPTWTARNTAPADDDTEFSFEIRGGDRPNPPRIEMVEGSPEVDDEAGTAP